MGSIDYFRMDVHQDFIDAAGVGSKEMLFSFRIANHSRAAGSFRRAYGLSRQLSAPCWVRPPDTTIK